MPLKAKQPKATEKRLKCLIFGEPGTGKTFAAIQFPKPYLIDAEHGAENDEYVQLLKQRGGMVLQTNQFDEIVEEVRTLLSEKHDFRTLIIDPITTVYDDMLDKAEQQVGQEFGRHYVEARKRWKRLVNLLLRLDMNIVITSHQKRLYGDEMKVMGNTFDGPKGMDYLFDLVFEAARRGEKRVAIVRKTRVSAFADAAVFDFCYDEIAERYGRNVLERDAVPVVLCPDEKAAKLRDLLKVRTDADALLGKWLTKAGADDIEEMTEAQADACIALLTNKGDK